MFAAPSPKPSAPLALPMDPMPIAQSMPIFSQSTFRAPDIRPVASSQAPTPAIPREVAPKPVEIETQTENNQFPQNQVIETEMDVSEPVSKPRKRLLVYENELEETPAPVRYPRRKQMNAAVQTPATKKRKTRADKAVSVRSEGIQTPSFKRKMASYALDEDLGDEWITREKRLKKQAISRDNKEDMPLPQVRASPRVELEVQKSSSLKAATPSRSRVRLGPRLPFSVDTPKKYSEKESAEKLDEKVLELLKSANKNTKTEISETHKQDKVGSKAPTTGSSPSKNDSTTKPLLNFEKAQATDAATERTDDKKPAFTFGAASTSSTESKEAKVSDAKPAFTFGSTLGTSASPKVGEGPKTTPAFGEKQKEDTSKPVFSFSVPAVPEQKESVTKSNPVVSQSPMAAPSTSSAANEEKPAFSFASVTESKPSEAKPAFSFGSTEITKPSEPKPAFTFGATTTTTSTTTAPAQTPAFSFSIPTSTPAVSAASGTTEAKPAFTFGAKPVESTAPSVTSQPAESKSVFSFGSSTTTSAEPSKPAFAFSTQPSTTTTLETKPAFSFPAPSPATQSQPTGNISATGGFTFGASSAAVPPSTGATTVSTDQKTEAPKFSWNAPTTSEPPKPAFGFGTTTTVAQPAPATSTTATPTPSFSWNQTTTASSSFTPAATAPSSMPAFGATVPQTTQSFGTTGTFNFQPSPAPTTSGPMMSQPAPSFNFGSNQQQQQSSFGFGATQPTAPTPTAPAFGNGAAPSFGAGNTGAFQFGAQNSAAPNTGFGSQQPPQAPGGFNFNAQPAPSSFQFGQTQAPQPAAGGGGFVFGAAQSAAPSFAFGSAGAPNTDRKVAMPKSRLKKGTLRR